MQSVLASLLIVLVVHVQSDKLGPVNLVVIKDESAYMVKVVLDPMDSFVKETFNLDATYTIVHTICSGMPDKVYLELTECQGDTVSGNYKKNFYDSLKKANETFEKEFNRPAPNMVIFYTDGKVTYYRYEEEKVEEAKEIATTMTKNGVRILMVWFNNTARYADANVNEADKAHMKGIAQKDENIVHIVDPNDVPSATEILRKAICGAQAPACKGKFDGDSKCNRDVTGVVGGCWPVDSKCEESECQCSDMYQLKEEPCSATCGESYKKKVMVGAETSECQGDKTTKQEKCPVPACEETGKDEAKGGEATPGSSSVKIQAGKMFVGIFGSFFAFFVL